MASWRSEVRMAFSQGGNTFSWHRPEGIRVDEARKSRLTNLALVLVTVLAVIVIGQFIRRGLRVRKELAVVPAATTGRTFPPVTRPADVLKDLLTSLSAGDREATLNRLWCTD